MDGAQYSVQHGAQYGAQYSAQDGLGDPYTWHSLDIEYCSLVLPHIRLYV